MDLMSSLIGIESGPERPRPRKGARTLPGLPPHATHVFTDAGHLRTVGEASKTQERPVLWCVEGGERWERVTSAEPGDER
jgi:hypothetical protein